VVAADAGGARATAATAAVNTTAAAPADTGLRTAEEEDANKETS
jgi:hypothetical protein